MSLSPSPEVCRRGDRTVVRLPGLDRLDESNSHEVGRELARLVEGLGRPRLVLDLAGIRYVSSTGLGQLVALSRKAWSAGGWLVLANPEPLVAEALAVTRLDTVLQVHPPPGRGASPGSIPA